MLMLRAHSSNNSARIWRENERRMQLAVLRLFEVGAEFFKKRDLPDGVRVPGGLYKLPAARVEHDMVYNTGLGNVRRENEIGGFEFRHGYALCRGELRVGVARQVQAPGTVGQVDQAGTVYGPGGTAAPAVFVPQENAGRL